MKSNKTITAVATSALVAAALTGLLSGAAYAEHSDAHEGMNKSAKHAAVAGTHAEAAAESAGKHDCKGHNSCKGKGGCKSGDNGCAGKNSCKGHGGCASEHADKK